MLPTASLWQPFGLRGSPFFQDELRPSQDADRPISLFVGRSTPLAFLLRRFASDSASRTIIEGAAGVGKTSFVNRVKASAAQLGVASHEHPIRITSDTTWHSFVREALRALLRIRLGLGYDNDADPFWKGTVLLLEGGESLGGGFSALGFGATVSRTRIAPALPVDSLYEHFGEALRRLKAESGAGVLLHVNNLENQALDNAPALAVLIRDLRDFLLLDGAHWVFVGTSGIDENIFRVYDQVGGIFPQSLRLPPLTADEMADLLTQRYGHLKIPGHEVVAPVEAKDAADLYAYYHGDLRNFLRLMGEAAERILGLHGLQPMQPTQVIGAVAPDYRHQLERLLGETDSGHLKALIGRGEQEFRVADVAAATRLKQPTATKLVERLAHKGVIRHVRTQGRSVFYRPTGSALIAFAAA
jgi:hypothetical protein